jgi:hypothetical protein
MSYYTSVAARDILPHLLLHKCGKMRIDLLCLLEECIYRAGLSNGKEQEGRLGR